MSKLDNFLVVTAGTAEAIVAKDTAGAERLCQIYNNGTVTAYLWGGGTLSGAGTAIGYPLLSYEKYAYLGSNALYAITAADTTSLRIHDSI